MLTEFGNTRGISFAVIGCQSDDTIGGSLTLADSRLGSSPLQGSVAEPTAAFEASCPLRGRVDSEKKGIGFKWG
jgi:hypothetical protein